MDDVYKEITDKIITAMEAGAVEFQMPWHRAAATGRPVNAVTGAKYNGVNVIALWAEAQAKGYTSPEWATYRQWLEIGAQVRKGERSTSCVKVLTFAARDDENDADDDAQEDGERVRLRSKRFALFNAAQVDGYTPKPTTPPRQGGGFEMIEEAEAFLSRSGADIRHGGSRAFYSPAQDYIALPNKSDFFGSKFSSPAESYYSTALHELTHWTGHASRLDRAEGMKNRFGSQGYAMEELVAELGAAFLCADLGVSVDPRLDHAAYLQSWLSVLKDDSRAIFTAASKAKTAAQWLHEHTGADMRRELGTAALAAAVTEGRAAVSPAPVNAL